MMDQQDDNGSSPVLHLNYSGISDLEEISAVHNYLEKIRYLYLKRNRLKSLSLVIHRLSNLVQIHLEGNNIEVLPDELGLLKHLEVLNIVSNNLVSLPKVVGELVSLCTLQVCNNKIVTLPKELGNLQCLETLEASRNQLSTIPKELCMCKKLKLLALDKNSIYQLPRQLCWLPNLKDLSLAGNCLEFLPPVIFKTLSSLRCIMLDNNPGIQALPKQSHPSQIIYMDSSLEKTRSGLYTYLNVDTKYYAIPPELTQLCVPHKSSVPCLEELAMKIVHRNLTHSSDALKLPIPGEAVNYLQYPTSYCMHCDMCIFKSGFPVLYIDQDSHLVTLEFCCSSSCVLSHNFQGSRVIYPRSTS